MVTQLLRTGMGIFSDWLEGRRRIQQARVDSQIAVEQARVQGDISWDQIHAQASATSWKDEFWTIIFAIPAVFAFIPPLVDVVNRGFEALTTMPDWYKLSLGTLVAASVGRQGLISMFNSRNPSNGS